MQKEYQAKTKEAENAKDKDPAAYAKLKEEAAQIKDKLTKILVQMGVKTELRMQQRYDLTNEKITDLKQKGSTEYEKLKTEYRALRKSGNKEGYHAKKADAEACKTKYAQEIQKLQEEANKIKTDLDEHGDTATGYRIDWIIGHHADPDMESRVGRNQLSHFLKKSNLSSDILKSKDDMKVEMQTRSVEHLTMQLENISKLFDKFPGTIDCSINSENQLVLETISSGDKTLTDEDIRTIIHYKEMLPTISQFAQELKKDNKIDEATFKKINDSINQMNALGNHVSAKAMSLYSSQIQGTEALLESEQNNTKALAQGIPTFAPALNEKISEMMKKIGEPDLNKGVLTLVDNYKAYTGQLDDKILELQEQKEAISKFIENNPCLTSEQKKFENDRLGGQVDALIAKYRQFGHDINTLITLANEKMELANKSQTHLETLQKNLDGYNTFTALAKSQLEEDPEN